MHVHRRAYQQRRSFAAGRNGEHSVSRDGNGNPGAVYLVRRFLRQYASQAQRQSRPKHAAARGALLFFKVAQVRVGSKSAWVALW